MADVAVQQISQDASSLEAGMAAAARALADAKRIVIFSGAGISAESGISTFRQPEVGIWANKAGLAYFGTPFGWWLTPKLAWKTYLRYFRNPIAAAQPNAGHSALAELERMHLAKSKGNRFDIVTQNVDALHQRSGSRSAHVWELHGTVYRHKCSKSHHIHEYELDAAALPPDYDVSTDEFFSSTQPPTCSHEGCSSYLRPDATLFTEGLPERSWRKAEQAISKLGPSDVLLVVGTSGSVQPAASLPTLASRHCTTIEINPDRSALTRHMSSFLPGPSGEVLPEITRQYSEIVGDS